VLAGHVYSRWPPRLKPTTSWSRTTVACAMPSESVATGGVGGGRGAAARPRRRDRAVEQMQLATAPDAARFAAHHDERDPTAAPCQVVAEAGGHDHIPGGKIERGQPAAPQLLPVVVVKAGATEHAAGGPQEPPVAREDGRQEIDSNMPAGRFETAPGDGVQPDTPFAANGKPTVTRRRRLGRQGGHRAEFLQLDTCLELPSGARNGLGYEQPARPLAPRTRGDDAVTERDDPLYIRDEVEVALDRHASRGSGSADVRHAEQAERAEMVQHRHEVGTVQPDDRMDVQVELRGLVVVGERRLVEDRAGPEREIGEDDVAAQVVPRAHAVERDDPADALGLRVHDAARGIRVDHQISVSAANTAAGSMASRHRAAAAHVHARSGRKPRRLTRSW
jgi:hypothetical protein